MPYAAGGGGGSTQLLRWPEGLGPGLLGLLRLESPCELLLSAPAGDGGGGGGGEHNGQQQAGSTGEWGLQREKRIQRNTMETHSSAGTRRLKKRHMDK
jgi:hypothetical protein